MVGWGRKIDGGWVGGKMGGKVCGERKYVRMYVYVCRRRPQPHTYMRAYVPQFHPADSPPCTRTL